MFANWLRIAEVMVLLNQTVEKFFLGCSSDLVEVDWMETFYWGGNGGLTNFNNSRRVLPTSRIVIVSESGRQSNVHTPFQLKQKPSANNIFELAIGLSPVPSLTKYSGDSRTAFAPMFFNNPAYEAEIILSNDPFAVGDYRVHEGSLPEFFSERTVFYKGS